MAYYTDLSEYDYFCVGKEPTAINVGWLERDTPFSTGDIPKHLVSILKSLCDQPIRMMMGIHFCDFCADRFTKAGNGEIRVIGCDSKVYAAPTLIHHYVTDHNYLPPEEFLVALEARALEEHLAEMQRWEI